jgi:hypothetical protein
MLNTYTNMVCDCKCVAISDCIAEPEAFESLLVFFLFCIAFSKPDVESDIFGSFLVCFFFCVAFSNPPIDLSDPRIAFSLGLTPFGFIT